MMNPLSPLQIQTAVATLKQGGVIAYPTEAVWGLGCDPFNEQAVLKLLALKQRPMAKGLILIAANVAQVEPYLQLLSSDERQRVVDSWPAAQTWVVPVTASVPQWIRGEHLSLAVRVSAHAPVQALCEAFGGAIISTSANISTQATAQNPAQIGHIFANQIDYIVDAPLGGNLNPSQIRDARTGAVLRPS
ncbi:MAG TPA: Sua5/YciO/YrdC/YwlC family protein [Agitococcus sp.]|jgi:L-threonylcarbamoyladenylate synthase|nr:Sua5/YciO/YrdC/YwlC family protein [Moraxellaceae bacterium]MBK8325878.1 Sua5/YciO/YrdC/YwlC family protein [Moraxellaceae bacterium]MBK9184832.1 Sua5/YciO/YrdC/YwlC family protein [Moraxellaceae bacterium]MCC6373351.1 Sua5/YciO/YrdC/YwlC family protein [Moraxellaceae bacterium]HQV79874.1 Sua5/YciO/YrdC/YwlC family protein [Agitococcus sp.]